MVHAACMLGASLLTCIVTVCTAYGKMLHSTCSMHAWCFPFCVGLGFRLSSPGSCTLLSTQLSLLGGPERRIHRKMNRTSGHAQHSSHPCQRINRKMHRTSRTGHRTNTKTCRTRRPYNLRTGGKLEPIKYTTVLLVLWNSV